MSTENITVKCSFCCATRPGYKATTLMSAHYMLAARSLLALRYARCAIAALLLPSIVGSGGLGLGRVTRTATWTNDCVFFTSANAADMV